MASAAVSSRPRPMGVASKPASATQPSASARPRMGKRAATQPGAERPRVHAQPSGPIASMVMKWDAKDVSIWLDTMSLGHLKPFLRGMTGKDLLAATPRALATVGIKSRHVSAILCLVAAVCLSVNCHCQLQCLACSDDILFSCPGTCLFRLKCFSQRGNNFSRVVPPPTLTRVRRTITAPRESAVLLSSDAHAVSKRLTHSECDGQKPPIRLTPRRGGRLSLRSKCSFFMSTSSTYVSRASCFTCPAVL